MNAEDLSKAKSVYHSGGVIAYPTEAVYGLGCDPNSKVGIEKIINLKGRALEKGLIIIAAQFEQLVPYINTSNIQDLDQILATWPGPYTWIFPSSKQVLPEVTGGRDTVAVRVSAHPAVQALCLELGPLTSTSANPSNQPPARTAVEIKSYFSAHVFGQIDCVIDGPVGGLERPTEIRDAISKKNYRNA